MMQNQEIEKQGTQLQQSLDLIDGPLLKLAYFHLGSNRLPRLLIISHHLIVDIVSWRVIIEDLQTVYQSLSRKQKPLLPLKSVSFKSWSEKLVSYAQTTEAKNEAQFWQDIKKQPVSRLPFDKDNGSNTVASIEMIYSGLSEDETRALLTDVPSALNTHMNDVLLLALTQAVANWSHGDSLYVDMEGHGREAILKGIDPSRTVGWFTTLYPVLIKLPEQTEIRQQLDSVAMQYQAIPNHGIGFGILRYLNNNKEIRQALMDLSKPEISFLYMGQFDQPFSADGLLTPAFDSVGPVHDPQAERPYLLEINSVIQHGRFQISWSYSRNIHNQDSIECLAGFFIESLREIINQAGECASDEASGLARASLDISDSDLAEILRQQGT
jgi:non-ribosomal peptide synthase protein (TIGR01720 family)